MAGRGYKTEAVVLRSIRFGEADRVLHLYTLERGRVGAVAKGIRRTKSRFGARLEPLSHVELMLHQGSGELATVTGASLVRPHSEAREDSYRLAVGLVGLEAMLRLFTEQERNPRAFEALTRFLDVLDGAERAAPGAAARPARPLVPAEAALALGVPAAPDELRRVRVGGPARRLLAAGRRSRVRALREPARSPLSGEGIAGIEGLLGTPLADAEISKRAAREALRVITSSYEYHGGFRLRTVAARA